MHRKSGLLESSEFFVPHFGQKLSSFPGHFRLLHCRMISSSPIPNPSKSGSPQCGHVFSYSLLTLNLLCRTMRFFHQNRFPLDPAPSRAIHRRCPPHPSRRFERIPRFLRALALPPILHASFHVDQAASRGRRSRVDRPLQFADANRCRRAGATDLRSTNPQLLLLAIFSRRFYF